MERPSIRRLPPELARKIAAGEVIERPASVVRELMENSIDSGAGAVSVSLISGGLDSIRVTDDGCGIPRPDMDSIALPHATSKIAKEEDLLGIATLGFRGEALSSMAAVADLEIVSAVEGAPASRYSSQPGRTPSIQLSAGKRGTSVTVEKLFDRFPARKRFLKRPATETTLSVQTFIDRALPHPGVEFRLTVDSRPRFLLPASSQKARVLSAYSFDEPESLFSEIKGRNGSFSYVLVFGSPEIRRPDRRHLQCFVNGRRVQDFSLQKAIEVGFSGFLPGGAFPVAFLFLSVDPEYVDFNIHPAKKEVRFRDPSSLHSGIVELARLALSKLIPRAGDEPPPFSLSPAGSLDFGSEPATARPAWRSPVSADFHSVRDQGGEYGHPGPAELHAVADGRHVPSTAPAPDTLKLLGQSLGTFILFERAGEIFFLDQHAAHERIVFESLQAKRPAKQELLVPFLFGTESPEEDEFLRSRVRELSDSGYAFEESGDGSWALVAHPEGLRSPLGAVVKDILSIRGSADLLRSLNAMTACKSAIKDGEILDEGAMRDLVERALSLVEPKCPHGRPIWTRISRDDLFRRVMRIV